MGVRVAVAMSGGVDSSVACLLLKKEGFDVVGLTMKLLPSPSPEDPLPEAPCCTQDMAEDARRICESLGISHYTLNLVSEFEEGVVLPFIRDYAAGKTPNPCLSCNRVMKFGHLLRKAREIGASYVATGHYARVGRAVSDGEGLRREIQTVRGGEAHVTGSVSEGRRLLFRGADRSKDQSYALYGLGQEELRSAMFPLGGLDKTKVRRIAEDAGLRTADRPESQEICFVAGGYRRYLADRGLAPEPGRVLDTSGRVLGRHTGLPFYTVGQRRGLGLGGGERLYVVELDVKSNSVVVGTRDEACSSGCTVERVNLIAQDGLLEPLTGTCMVRYRGKETAATMVGLESAPPGDPLGPARIDFATPQFAVTPGQAAVIYQGDLCCGGGTIVERIP